MNERIKFESKGTNLDQRRQRRLRKLAQDTSQIGPGCFELLLGWGCESLPKPCSKPAQATFQTGLSRFWHMNNCTTSQNWEVQLFLTFIRSYSIITNCFCNGIRSNHLYTKDLVLHFHTLIFSSNPCTSPVDIEPRATVTQARAVLWLLMYSPGQLFYVGRIVRDLWRMCRVAFSGARRPRHVRGCVGVMPMLHSTLFPVL